MPESLKASPLCLNCHFLVLNKERSRKITKLVRENFARIIGNQLVAGSAILFIGNGLVSFGNYLYHLIMGRMLGPIDYGVLASLISLTYLLGIPVNSLNLVVVKYVAAMRGRKEWGGITYFYSWLNKKISLVVLAIFLILVILLPKIASFLHLDSTWSLLLVILAGLVSVYFMINQSFLQGFLHFGRMSIAGMAWAFSKIGVAVILVLIGWGVLGAAWSILISVSIGLLLTFFFTTRLLKDKQEKKKILETREVVGYTLPVFLSTLAFTSLYTTDVVLARHFLSAQEAGFYASLATLGKIIFFAANPIVMAMFPIVSEKHANGKNYGQFFILSLGLVFLVCLGVSGLYFLFPKLMVEALYGHQYLSAAAHLWPFAIFISFYSLSFLIANYYLSIKRVKIIFLPILAALTQIILIIFFHQDLRQTVLMSMITTAFLLGMLLIYNLFLDKTSGIIKSLAKVKISDHETKKA